MHSSTKVYETASKPDTPPSSPVSETDISIACEHGCADCKQCTLIKPALAINSNKKGRLVPYRLPRLVLAVSSNLGVPEVPDPVLASSAIKKFKEVDEVYVFSWKWIRDLANEPAAGTRPPTNTRPLILRPQASRHQKMIDTLLLFASVSVSTPASYPQYAAFAEPAPDKDTQLPTVFVDVKCDVLQRMLSVALKDVRGISIQEKHPTVSARVHKSLAY